MILITRPKEDNDKLSILLSEKNIKHEKDNLTSFRTLKKKIEYQKNKIFLIASKQAVKSLAIKKNINELRKSGFIVIGNKVKKELQKLKIKKILFFANESELLLKKIKLNQNLKNQSLEYLCSNIYNKQFVKDLKKLNFRLTLNQVYETIPKKTLKKSTIKRILSRKIKIIIFFSVFTFVTFKRLCRQHGLKRRDLDELIFIAFSDRIAREIKKSKYQVKTTKSSTLNELIHLLIEK
tara:strand:- start:389 stop:1099 length:711 start_codon:yes stop_codon:yes gene_type:complete